MTIAGIAINCLMVVHAAIKFRRAFIVDLTCSHHASQLLLAVAPRSAARIVCVIVPFSTIANIMSDS
jgi:hypothetical protein